MTSDIRRATEHELVMSQITPKPKPVKEKKSKRKLTMNRKTLEGQLKAMVYQIIMWRDGQDCVQKGMGECKNGLSWGHYVAQGQSAWLRYDLGNVHVQCGSHNLRDYNNDKSYSLWFNRKFGLDCSEALDRERAEHSRQDHPIYELREMLEHYDQLYQDRYFVRDVGDVNELVEKGYYGKVIQRVFRER